MMHLQNFRMASECVCIVLAFCLTFGCRVDPDDGKGGEKDPQSRLAARDRDNNLELALEVVGGMLKKGERCTFRITVTNISTKTAVVLPEFFLRPHFLANTDKQPRPRRYDKGMERTPGGSWRSFYWEGPFYCRGMKRELSPRTLYGLGPIHGGLPNKEAQRKELEDYAVEIQLQPSWLQTVTLSPEHFCGVDVCVKIPGDAAYDADYVDMGMYFDLDKLGYNGALTVTVNGPIHGSPEQKLPIWQGFLYVFLKIPE